MMDTDIIIEHLEIYSASELIDKLKMVSMLENDQVFPYENAFISIERVNTDILNPCQLYILESQLNILRTLKWRLEEQGINMFELDGYVRMKLKGHKEPMDLLPPIIEESIEKNGDIALIINDGMHRCYMARLEWLMPYVVYIRGIPKNLPYYAYPIPNRDWSAVEKFDDIENMPLINSKRKWHRIENNKLLYRNFNSAFMSVGKPRELKYG